MRASGAVYRRVLGAQDAEFASGSFDSSVRRTCAWSVEETD
jgi:hypothetical protein